MEIKGFIKSSLIDWPGKISSVIFLPGCNFRCPFCHNKDLVICASRIPTIPEGNIIRHLTNYKQWIDGVVITGGEPCIHPDIEEFIVRLKSHGLAVKLDTNGSFPDVLKRLVEKKLIDYVAMDIKTGLDEKRYKEAVATDISYAAIRESIMFLLSKIVPYEFRTTIVPSLVKKEDIVSISQLIGSAPRWVWQPFRPENTLDSAYMKVPPYSENILYEWEEEANQMMESHDSIVRI